MNSEKQHGELGDRVQKVLQKEDEETVKDELDLTTTAVVNDLDDCDSDEELNTIQVEEGCDDYERPPSITTISKTKRFIQLGCLWLIILLLVLCIALGLGLGQKLHDWYQPKYDSPSSSSSSSSSSSMPPPPTR
jgi:hypothetical protein